MSCPGKRLVTNNMRIRCRILTRAGRTVDYTTGTVRILCVATKPPWPPRDGGRLALWLTLQGLAAAGHDIALVAPRDETTASTAEAVERALRAVCTPHLVSAAKRNWITAWAAALFRGQALSVARHHLPEVEQAVAECIADWRPDVLHVEQLQAMANCETARAAGIPVVLRMQNVESSLWRQVAMARLRSRALVLEAHRLRTNEARAMAKASRVVALTERDAADLRDICGDAQRHKLVAVCPPFPSSMSAGPALGDSTAIVLAGSAGWWPNTEGMRWFLDQVAPLLATELPQARVHVYGGTRVATTAGRSGAVWHPAPEDAAQAFPAGAIAAIPLHIGSGIRMRILEAWARGLPVVATSIAAAGLQVESGRELMIADTPADFATAIRTLAREDGLRAALVAAGRNYLAKHHERGMLTQALVAQYEAARTQGL